MVTLMAKYLNRWSLKLCDRLAMSTGLMNPLRLLLLGAPGAGKGTQTARLLTKFPQLNSVSSGDLLRQQIQKKTPLGSLAASYIFEGKLLPDEVVTRLITTHLQEAGWLSPKATWLLDGFPRTLEQGKMLRTALSKYDTGLTLVVELDVPESVILERIENRYVHIPSGRVYNLQYKPPKVPGIDDITGEPLSKRSDDTAEVFKKRLDEYHRTVGPLKDFYAKRGLLKAVSGDTSDVITPKLFKLIDKYSSGH
ncbi:hypothetical protein HG537_0G03000 [Torulaspora globosa]|uniref:GTP:AMP phosphotransferase, mitochondrial n=1 Tax=Torulaspora globosa TaxID=48254 RepID=A0A7H9HZP8_9SACH|nr:hypothetical protein HG537_0G03000 [Torulaspora sp. CBS 2947]